MKKILISIFCVLNIVAVLFSNRPTFTSVACEKFIDSCLNKTAAYNIRYLAWYFKSKIQMYAYLAGLGNHWIMFGYQNHFNWWYRIYAKYGSSQKILLPLPRQSKRTFWQWYLFDFKEAKFHHNIYADAAARESYAKYLCRQFPTHNNSPIKSIEYELYWQQILEPKIVRETGKYLDSRINMQLLNTFNCPEIKPEVKPEIKAEKKS